MKSTPTTRIESRHPWATGIALSASRWLTATLLCAGLGTALAASNLLTNPGFEQGMAGWSGTLRGGNVATIVADPQAAHSGNAYCSALNGGGWSSIAQGSASGWGGSGVDTPLSDQKYYQLSAWVKVPGASGAPQAVTLRFRFQPSADRWDVGQQTIADESWHQLVGPWLNPRAGDNLLGYFEVHTVANGVTVCIDDCSLEESDGCAITGITQDDSGKPVEGALVQLKLDGTVAKTTISGASGAYTFHVEPTAGVHYTLNASKLNYSSPATDVGVTTVATPGVATAPALVLKPLPMVTISGVVTDATSGARVAGAVVTATSATGSMAVKTDAEGKYSMVVAADSYLMTAIKLPLSIPAQTVFTFDAHNSPIDVTADFALSSVLLVGLYADQLPPGALTVWTNKGTLGGEFKLLGSTAPVAGSHGKFKSVYLNNNQMVLSQGNDFMLAPVEITGPAANYTVSAWLFEPDPTLPDQQTYISWAKRGGPDGSNAEMVYGVNTVWGAAGHWGAPDLPWGTPPTGGTWHNVIVTWDGSVESDYIDGVFSTSETKTLNIGADLPIVLGSGYWYDGTTVYPDIPFSGYIAQVEIFAAPATAEEAARLASLSPPPLPTATLAGKVVTTDSSAKSGYGITMVDSAGVVQATAATGADGAYSCVVAAPGSYTVKAIKAGYVTMPAPQVRTVAAGQTVTLADFAATPSTITGVLKDATTGTPIYNGVVQTGGNPGDPASAVITDASGAYSLPGTGCGGVEVYADAINYAGRSLVVTGTGQVRKDIALTADPTETAEPNPRGLNGDMEDLVGGQPTQWQWAPWNANVADPSAPPSIDFMASTVHKTGNQSLFYTTTDSPAQYDGIVKVISLRPGYSYNFWFSAKADPETLRWQPLVEFQNDDGSVWNGFVSAEPSFYEYAHTPPYDWYTYRLWFDRGGTRNGLGLRWKPSDSRMTQCWFKFLYEWANGGGPPAGKGCYIDDLVLDAVPDNLAAETVAPDSIKAPALSITMSGGVPSFPIPTTLGRQYRIAFKNDLSDATWTPIGDWTPGTGSEVILSDSGATGKTQRFYRLEVQ